MKPIAVVLADDHSLFREGLVRLLDCEPDLQVVAQASTGREVLQKVAEAGECVVLMDITMPEMDGIEATRLIVERHPAAKVLILSASENKDHLFSCIKAGAQGYVLKDSAPAELMEAIRIVAAGGSVIDPTITPQLLAGVREMGYDRIALEKRRLNLSDRELEILTALSKARTPVQIGQDLGISAKTVQNHISSLYRKMGVGNRAEAVAKAIELGLAHRE